MMIKYVVGFIILIHGLIHLMGFSKAFGFGDNLPLSREISKPLGIIWLATALLIIFAGVLYLLKKDSWIVLGIIGIALSQILIFTSWQDAKFGTIANLIIAVALFIGYNTLSFIEGFETEVSKNIATTAVLPTELLTESDMEHLPEPVKKYLEYAGVIGKPKVNNFKVEFKGKIRKNEASPWMPFKSVQYNFMASSTRLFFMDAIMMRLPVAGFHSYHNGDAFMDIRLLSSFKVEYQDGLEMGIAETVTFFNDMCCMAPATLIDDRVKWLMTDGDRVLASFTTNDITIHAWLYFNEGGQLINFISEDRYANQDDGTMKKLEWSTPLKNYKNFDGRNIAGYADAIYKYPDGDLCYGIFETVNVEYNATN